MINGLKAQRQVQGDGLGRRHWKDVQKDFGETEKWTGFVGAVQRPVEWKNIVGWYIGASTERHIESKGCQPGGQIPHQSPPAG